MIQFFKNAIIKYLENKITGDYLDFSWDKNLMIISKNVVLENDKSFLQADVVEVNMDKRYKNIYV